MFCINDLIINILGILGHMVSVALLTSAVVV